LSREKDNEVDATALQDNLGAEDGEHGEQNDSYNTCNPSQKVFLVTENGASAVRTRFRMGINGRNPKETF
jgi:hypothetical protein